MSTPEMLIIAGVAYFLYTRRNKSMDELNTDDELTDTTGLGDYGIDDSHPITHARKKDESITSRTTETPPSGDFYIAGLIGTTHNIELGV